MQSILALLLIVALASQSLGFVMNGRHNLFKKSPLAPLRMAAPTDGSWVLKTVTKDKLFTLVSDAITKQLDEVAKDSIKMESNLVSDFEADSVDIVSMMLGLETIFKEQLTATGTKVPMDKLGKVQTVKDLFDLMHDVIQEVESKQ